MQPNEVGIRTELALLARKYYRDPFRPLELFSEKELIGMMKNIYDDGDTEEYGLTLQWRYQVNAIGEDGKILGSRSGVGLNTTNWGNCLSSLLSNAGDQFTVTTLTNTSATLLWYSNNTIKSYFGATYAQLGTGTTAATRADYNLETPSAGNTGGIIFSYAGTGSMTGSGSITYATAQSPSELGLIVEWSNNGTGATLILFDHAVFAALPAATTFTITYSVSLS